jgi:hypothetical protein
VLEFPLFLVDYDACLSSFRLCFSCGSSFTARMPMVLAHPTIRTYHVDCDLKYHSRIALTLDVVLTYSPRQCCVPCSTFRLIGKLSSDAEIALCSTTFPIFHVISCDPVFFTRIQQCSLSSQTSHRDLFNCICNVCTNRKSLFSYYSYLMCFRYGPGF